MDNLHVPLESGMGQETLKIIFAILNAAGDFEVPYASGNLWDDTDWSKFYSSCVFGVNHIEWLILE